MLTPKPVFGWIVSLGFSICLLGAAAYGSPIDQVLQPLKADSLPSRDALYSNFFRSRSLVAVYGGMDRETVRSALERSPWGRRTRLEVRHVDETTAEDLRQGVVLLIGSPEANPLLKQLPMDMPFTFRDQGFSLLGKTYRGNGDAFSLLYPNPYNTEYPLFIVAGFDESHIIEALDLSFRQYDYQVLRNGQRIRVGHFSQESGHLWQYDAERDIDFEADIRLVGSTSHFRFYTHNTILDQDVLAELIRERQKAVEAVSQFLPQPVDTGSPISYYLYGSIQNKGVITDDMDFAHVDHGERAVHVAIEGSVRGDGLGRETRLALQSALGRPAIRMLEEGLSIYLNTQWFGKSYQEWLSRIAHADMALSADVLLDNDTYENASPLLREPLAAGMVQCMIEEWGKETLLTNYRDWTPTTEELSIIETVWEGCLNHARAAYIPTPKRFLRTGDQFQRGFNFAHEGYGIINGYGSVAARESLSRLAHMGSNAVSIIPYTFMRDTATPTSFRLPNTVGDENDTAVAHAAQAARDLGFTTMLKPQIWVRGSWPGDIEMSSEADWKTFFDHYRQWIGHYALLAEIFDIDIVCIGTELTRATLAYPDRWVDMANDLRSIYGGQLVYAPNWGEEFEGLKFWDAFDFVGLNSYYPLSEEDNPTEAALRKGADEIARRIEKTAKKFGKQVLLTEIGFASTPNPWKLPYLENRNEPAMPDHQALCYRIMAEALSGKKGLQGIYWWKWPSHLGRGGMAQKGFTPNGKPAAEVVANWYRSFDD